MQAAGPSENARALRVSEEVREAVASHKPVVALESTIISHGLPYPRNLEVARQLEGLVRSLGAVPATVAVLGGVPCVGITAAELDLLALPESGVLKASSRDLPVVCAQRRHAGGSACTRHAFVSVCAAIYVVMCTYCLFSLCSDNSGEHYVSGAPGRRACIRHGGHRGWARFTTLAVLNQ